jgi:hypothetical protein
VGRIAGLSGNDYTELVVQFHPLAMKLVTFQVEVLYLRIAYLASWRVLAAVQSAGDFPSLRGSCLGDEMDDRFVVSQWFTPPI